MDWNGLDGNGLEWIALNWIALNWSTSNCHHPYEARSTFGFGSISLEWIALDCDGLHWIADSKPFLSIDPIELFTILKGETLIAILFHYNRYPIYRGAISTI